MSKNQSTFYTRPGAEVLKTFTVDPAKGLSEAEVTQRLEQYGPNELPRATGRSPLKLFLQQFKDILIIILIIAATVSLGLELFEGQPVTEAALIYLIVLAIAVVGFLNEYKAEKTVEALRALMSHTAIVRRDGEEREVSVDQLVPGDIVLLDEGKKMPADLRLLTASRLQTSEASLTGESAPVSKSTDPLTKVAALGDQKNMVFSGTLVTTGTAEGVVVATGLQTEIGKISKLVSEVEDDETPMQRKLDELGKKLGLIIMLICAVVFVVIFWLDQGAAQLSLAERLIFAFTAAVALAVAAIPEGLAFVVRISLALGARRMAAKNALVRKLSAVESLGSTDVVCSDKTGTLTRGEMTVRQLYANGDFYQLSGTGYEAEGKLEQEGQPAKTTPELHQLLTIGLLCNNAHLKEGQILGDPTEGSLLVSAAKLVDSATLVGSHPRLHEIPFSSQRKMMTTVHTHDHGVLVAVKGAPDVMLQQCAKQLVDGKVVDFTAEQKQRVQAAISQMAAQALRVLGFAYQELPAQPADENDLEKDLIFVGLQGMMDPPRIEVKEVIQRVQREAGMKVIMITGDNIETAKAVAREIGIEGEALLGTELDTLTEQEFLSRVETIGVYARVNPEHKIQIVRALQKQGHQVAMTGDGVNDAPAIKAADIGIAMGITGTDAAKEAADMVLLDDQFLTIINAVEEGRGIYDNVRKFVNFLLSCNIGEVFVVLFGILLHGNLVLTAAQLLFINIVTDGLPAVALGSDPTAKNVMRFKPQRYQQAIITPRLWAEIVVSGMLMSVILLWQYAFNLSSGGVLAATSAVFIGMVIYEFTRLVDIRTDYHLKWFSNPWLSVSIVVSLLIQFVILYWPPAAELFNVEPPSMTNWLIIGVGAVALFVGMKLLNPLFDKIGPENRHRPGIDEA